MDRTRILIAPILLIGLALGAASAHASDQQRFREFFRERVTVKAEPVTGEAYGKVFRPGIYLVTTGFDYPGLGKHSFHAALRDDQVVPIGNDRGGGRKKNLESMLRPEFTIASRADAQSFENALNAIYLGDFGNTRDHAVVRGDNQWLFVRDEAFGDYKGFVVALDGDNRVQSIRFSDELPVSKEDLQ
jgi:hypothetical protein